MYLAIAGLSWPLLRGLFRLRARGREHLPQGGFVLAANHNSNFDPWPLGVTLVPKRYLRFMGKSELFWTPFKQFATAAGAKPEQPVQQRPAEPSDHEVHGARPGRHTRSIPVGR